MSAPSKQDMLDNVETAINNLMAGGAVQSYSINGRNIQKFSLSELMKLRDTLRAELSQVSGTTNYAGFGRPS